MSGADGAAAPESRGSILGATAKDYAVYVPIIGTSLAFAWEVGLFVPIGGAAFGMFSISEHIVFALQALPVALVAAFLVICMHLLYRRHARVERLEKIGSKSWSIFIVIAMSSAIPIALEAFVIRLMALPVVWGILLFIQLGFAVFIFMKMTRYRYAPKNRLLSYILIAIYIEGFAIAFGADQMRIVLWAGDTSTLQTPKGNVDLVVLRSSPTGLIGYDRPNDKLVYLRGETIKQRTWRPRSNGRTFPD
ncbi:hypothetical protein ACWX0K_10920 [Nitrobacteraceae bacterium UC4446_H13]